MKWQAVLAGAFASALITSVACAEVRVTNDPGGEITSYVTKFENMRASGERLVIDGPCLSACTLVLGTSCSPNFRKPIQEGVSLWRTNSCP